MAFLINETPLILTGPILRRVEPALVTVWVALKASATVKIDVYEGLQFAGSLPASPIASGELKTVAIGQNLHVAAVTAPPESELEPGRFYSYNVVINREGAATTSLKEEGLLENKSFNGQPHYALGYVTGRLPCFVLPADDIGKLKIIHGSCRNNDNRYDDALAYVDDLLRPLVEQQDAEGMPQQIFLSGDQIYADSVVGALLNMLTQRASLLIGDNEFLPTAWKSPEGKSIWRANARNLPAYIRDRLMDSEARFTSSDVANHLISFGEYAAMYLCVWSNAIWDPDDLLNFEQVLEKIDVAHLPEPWGAVFREFKTDQRTGKKPVFADPLLKNTLDFLFGTLSKPQLKGLVKGNSGDSDRRQALNKMQAFKNTLSADDKPVFDELIDYFTDWFGGQYRDEAGYELSKSQATGFLETLPKVRRVLATIPSYMMCDDHEVTDDWNLNPIWRDRVYTSPLGRTILRNGLMAYAVFQDWGNRPLAYNRKGHLFELDKALADELTLETLTTPLKEAFANKEIALESEKTTVKKTADGEWHICDEQTGDEFLLRKYKEDDREFLKVLGNPHAFLLEQIPQLFKKDEGPDAKIESTVDWLLGLDQAMQPDETGRYKLPENRTPPVKWHYSYEGPKHKVLVIDNRTRRTFVSRQGPPGNLSFKGMDDLIPSNPQPQEDEVLFVVAPLPVVGPPLLDELVAPLVYRVYDSIAYFQGKENVKSGMAGTNPDAIEAWAFDPVSLEELLKRLAPFRRIILLSGDVHYGSSQALTYWTKGSDQPARFAQFTSSGFRNIMPHFIQVVSKHLPLAQKLLRAEFKADRVGWFKHDPNPFNFTGDPPDPHLKELLRESPLVLSTFLLPDGTKLADPEGNPPDWAWRLHPLRDERPENERPGITRNVALETINDSENNRLDGVRKIVARHAKQIQQFNYTRQFLLASNFGLVSFRKENGKLIAVHELYALPTDMELPGGKKAEIFARHEVPFLTDEPKPVIGEQS